MRRRHIMSHLFRNPLGRIVVVFLLCFHANMWADSTDQRSRHPYSISNIHPTYNPIHTPVFSTHSQVEKRVAANTFSTRPCMQVKTIISSLQETPISPLLDAQLASPMRPPHRAPEEGDEKPEGWTDPMPLGDLPWRWICLLVAGYCLARLRLRKVDE